MNSYLPGQEVMLYVEVEYPGFLRAVTFYLVNRDDTYDEQPTVVPVEQEANHGMRRYRAEHRLSVTGAMPPGVYEVKGVDIATEGGQVLARNFKDLGYREFPSFTVELEPDKNTSMRVTDAGIS